MKKFEIKFKCRSCTHKYRRVFYAEQEGDLDDQPNPACPKCAKKARRTDTMQQAMPPIEHSGLDGIIAEQRAPGINGASVVKAIDQTAEIVMADHQLSNLKDNIRVGETMAPRLPPVQQKLADNFFGGGQVNARQRARFQRLGQNALKGAYRSTSVDVKAVLPDQRVALRRVGVEQIRR